MVHKKWTYQKCFIVALTCKTRSELKRKYPSAYVASRKNRWLVSFNWFVDGRRVERIYKWTEKLATEEAKKYKNISEFARKALGAYKYAKRHNLLDSFIWFKNYKPKSRIKWTHDAVIAESKKYSSRTEFNDNSGGAYSVACKKGWIDEMPWLSPKVHYWTYEECYEEAKKYDTKNHFRKGNYNAAQKASKMGWMRDYTWFKNGYKKQSKWTHDLCIKEAKKYDSRGHFKAGNPTCYRVARENGWLDEMTWFKDLSKYIFERNHCVYRYLFKDRSVYIGRTCNKNKRNRDHRDITKNKNISAVAKYFLEQEKQALHAWAKSFIVQNPFASMFNNYSVQNSLNYISKNYVTESFSDLNKLIIRDLDVPKMEIIEDNLTPEESLEREDYWVKWYKKNKYNVLNKAKTGRYTGSLGTLAKKWNKTRCYEEAKKYKTRGEFLKKSPSCYDAARRNGWLNDYTWFPKRHRNKKGMWTIEQ